VDLPPSSPSLTHSRPTKPTSTSFPLFLFLFGFYFKLCLGTQVGLPAEASSS